ncbi:Asp/Glu racemase [Mycolicibacterium holsaticum]|jgi:maleate isomerase|uniref:maleate cis-trans isomerase family protein n=1 Tax=Mycolicibacterium holsaticum TaxID=152142 RepID=UPI000A51AE99|nr:Asp/Glu racemase [Mycolicibacterium holsaticum]MDA4106737.1 Asp/Glu/hydantoin racemase [Mycolicibacterium holsaticum DSM 44478 = JCM 12374]QZA12993.1 Asp/Glu racemase [Mycolicibacterium holsaticum DSM 44478 = JCM 12374]UNC09531.1 Asp/Glu racemase [Mycolicibacterium holsaticum DSM 44478 = JCM 12374]
MTLGDLVPPPPLQQVGVGVVTPYDFALDRELWRWVPDDVSLYVTRLRYAPLPVTVDMAVHVSDADNVVAGAANVLAVAPLVTAYACTAGSFVKGMAGEAALVAAMQAAGAPAAVTTSGSMLAALRHLGVHRVATVTPYTADLTIGLTSYLMEAGLEVVSTSGLGLTSHIWAVPYEQTAELVRSTDVPEAEAIVVSCTNLPTYDLIARLEAELHKPVVTANQVTMWAALRVAGRKAVGPGQRLIET